MTLCSSAMTLFIHFLFFQAEDGIRVVAVTGVQTCALPIYGRAHGPATADGASTPPTLPLSIRTEQATPLRACWLWQTQRPANARNLFSAPALLRDSVDQFPRFFTTPPQTTSSADMFPESPARKSPVGSTN